MSKKKYKTKELPLKEWQKMVTDRGDIKKIKFRCPVCGNYQSVEDFKALKVDNDTIGGVFYYSCIGRYSDAKNMSEKPCNYTSGGLFVLNDLFVIKEDGKKTGVFDFVENPLCEEVTGE